jgi:hypothetical protein
MAQTADPAWIVTQKSLPKSAKICGISPSAPNFILIDQPARPFENTLGRFWKNLVLRKGRLCILNNFI